MLEEDETEVQDEDYLCHIYMTSSLKQLIEVAREKFAFKEKDKLILMYEEDEKEVQDNLIVVRGRPYIT